MSISSVIRAPRGSYNPDDSCAVCLSPLNPLLDTPVIHEGENGAKHPMHAKCLKDAMEKQVANQHPVAISLNPFDFYAKDCPVCKDRIFWPLPKDSLNHKIIGASTVIVMAGAAHATFSYLTGWPLIGAITPSVISSLMSIESLWLRNKEWGLERSLGVEIARNLATSALVIGVPLLASMAASHITESIIPNSLITATLGVGGLFPHVMKFLNDI